MRILIVAKEFPPTQTARAQQSARLAAALSDQGASVTVVAGTTCAEGLRSRIAGVDVRYARYFDGPASHATVRRVIRLGRQFIEVAGLSPWVKGAYAKACHVIGEQRPDIVLSQSVPFDSHRVGRCLKEAHDLPWAAFLSDPWPLGLMPPPYRDRELSLLTWFQARDSRRVLRSADLLIAPSDAVLEFMVSNGLVESRILRIAIPHVGAVGVDAPVEPIALHAGEITRERASKEAITGLAEASRTLSGRGRIVLLGRLDENARAALASEIEEGLIEVRDHVPQDAARSAVASAKVLLLLEADCPGSPFLPSKLADYALTGRPIVAITPADSAVRKLAARLPQLHAARHNANEIVSAVLRAWESREDDVASALDLFAPENVANRYLEALQAVCNGRPAATLAVSSRT